MTMMSNPRPSSLLNHGWQPAPKPELDYRWMDRELDRVKTKVFMQSSGVFLANIMCTLKFEWTEKFSTAATDGKKLMWNPYYFWFLKPEARMSILVHELWHVAKLHMIRRGNRDPRRWNIACDTNLDNTMDYDGFCMNDADLFPIELFPPGSKGCINHDYDNLSAEQIYDIMTQNEEKEPQGYEPDLIEPKEVHEIISNVVAAVHANALAGGKLAGHTSGDVETILNTFLRPKLPWHKIYRRFFNDLAGMDYSFRKPSRRGRANGIYLPSLVPMQPSLKHLIYYFDVSGSVDDDQVIRFNSETRYVWQTYKPEKLTIVQFDTAIKNEFELKRGEQFNQLKVIGRGGTSLVPVRQHILDNKATAVIVFSDLECQPMEPLPAHHKIPLIWVCINNMGAQVNEGTLIHIRE